MTAPHQSKFGFVSHKQLGGALSNALRSERLSRDMTWDMTELRFQARHTLG